MNIAAALSPYLYCCCCTSSLDEEVKDTPSAGYAGLSLLGIADCVTAPDHCTLLYIYRVPGGVPKSNWNHVIRAVSQSPSHHNANRSVISSR